MTVIEFTEAITADITRDMDSGIVPRTVAEFSELHDYVDANCYGGSEGLVDEIGIDAVVDLFNAAMPAVNEWLKANATNSSR